MSYVQGTWMKKSNNMKRLFTVSLLLASFLAFANAQRTYVLSTGVSSYQNQENNLRQTTKDAKAFKAVMQKQTPDVSILTSKYANHNNILEKLRTICNRATENDNVVFFFSGHGFTGGIASYDSPIFYRELTRVLSASKAKTKIVYVDACHSGSVANQRADGNYEILKEAAKGDNIIFFMSCRSDELSAENVWAGDGYFTHSLLKGLRGKADKNNDRAVTVIELFNYVYKDVVHSTRNSSHPQHPQLIAPKSSHNTVLMQW